MHKKNNFIIKLLKITFSIGMISLFYSLVRDYSSQLGLFNNINVKIKGNQFVTTQRIQEEVSSFLNQSLLSLSLKEIQNSLSTIDFIETAQVSHILPNTLMIQILERKPILLITIDSNLLFMDKKGNLLPADYSSINFFPVPIITISEEMDYVEELPAKISELFQFILIDHIYSLSGLMKILW